MGGFEIPMFIEGLATTQTDEIAALRSK